MKRSTGKMTKRQERRVLLLKEEGCVACAMDRRPAPGGEYHHFNLDGKAGQRRLGHDDGCVLCRWHHRGAAPFGYTVTAATERFGPSLAHDSGAFRDRYGDDAALLTYANESIGHAFCVPTTTCPSH